MAGGAPLQDGDDQPHPGEGAQHASGASSAQDEKPNEVLPCCSAELCDHRDDEVVRSVTVASESSVIDHGLSPAVSELTPSYREALKAGTKYGRSIRDVLRDGTIDVDDR